MKKRNLILSIIFALIVIHITSVIFIYSYASMSVLENSIIYLLNSVALMYVVKVVLRLFKSKINNKILNTIFIVILLINIIVAVVAFKEFIL